MITLRLELELPDELVSRLRHSLTDPATDSITITGVTVAAIGREPPAPPRNPGVRQGEPRPSVLRDYAHVERSPSWPYASASAAKNRLTAILRASRAMLMRRRLP